MAKLKSWYDVVDLRDDLTQGKPLDASEFAVNLDHIRDGRAHADYTSGARFFDRTYVSKSLLDLTSQVVRRLSGIQVETSAVFNMATQFGGGKSHSLATLYHLAMNGERAQSWKGVDSILLRAEVQKVPKAAVAVFTGTEFDPLTGRGGNGEPVRKTPWGEIAWQLGGEKAFAAVAQHDAQGIAPGGDVVRQMLPEGPCLILVDELLNYISRGRKLGAGSQLYNFLHVLSEEARARQNLVLCVSLPASVLEMNPEDQRDYESFSKMLERLGKAITMSAEYEMAEIIRRRLFQWEGPSSDSRKTVSAYSEWALDNAGSLVGVEADSVRQLFEASYPFHPSVLSVFERKWQTLPQFQRTRGVLKLLALWVAHVFKDQHFKSRYEPLIMLGSAPLDDPTFRSAAFKQLGSDLLTVPVTTDIAGSSTAHAIRLDNDAAPAIKKAQLHQKVATVIFFESNGGQSQSRAEATLAEIKLAVGGPDSNLAEVDTVLEDLMSDCFYLNSDKNRYRFGLTPNLNQVLVNRRGTVQIPAINERIRQTTEAIFNEGSKALTRKYWPTFSNDIPSVAALTLVVLGLDMAVDNPATQPFIASLIRDCGNSGRTFKSALIFAVPDGSHRIHEAGRDWLAWEDINDDVPTKDRLDDGQKQTLDRSLKHAKSDFRESILRAYRHLYLLGKDNQLRAIDLGNITSSGSGSLVEIYLQRLGGNGLDEIVDSVPARKLASFWPASQVEWSTKAVRDAFYSSPLLPRLLNPEAIKRTIADGVQQGLIGYATKDATGRLHLEQLKESLFDTDVEISDDVFILKGDDAIKLKEPPRLDKLVIKPDHAMVMVGEQVSFTCSGVDQYGEPFAIDGVTWFATIGTVTPQGLFTAGLTGGLHTVKAQIGSCESLAEVRITAEHEAPPPAHTTPGERIIRWRGAVPSQKWMNFYTKILSKFANAQGLKIEVNFEVKVDQEHSDAKAGETRSGLKELGLSDQVDVV